MNQVYRVLSEVKDHFEVNGITNKVTFGDIHEIDADKSTMIPLTNIYLSSLGFNDVVSQFTVTVHCLGWKKELKTVDPDNDFYGANNVMDVLNEQYFVLGKFIKDLSDGELYDSFIRLNGNPVADMVMDLGPNNLCGWSANINIDVKNEISGC